jgi:translation initiation factor IF-2
MSDVTVAQFAEVLKVPVDRLLVQLESAGIQVAGPQALISDEAKLELLTHLRRAHGAAEPSKTAGAAAPRKITLARKSQSELKQASTQGRARTVNVEVRHKKTYIKRDVLEEQNKQTKARPTRSARNRKRPKPPSASARKRAQGKRAHRGGEPQAASKTRPPRRSRPKKPARAGRAARQAGTEAQRRAAAEAAALCSPRVPSATSPKRRRGRVRGPAKDTRYGRQELHVAGGVGARNKKKKRVKERTAPAA